MLFEIRGQNYQNSKLFSLSFHYKIIVGIFDGVLTKLLPGIYGKCQDHPVVGKKSNKYYLSSLNLQTLGRC